jgi:hypothetical protein
MELGAKMLLELAASFFEAQKFLVIKKCQFTHHVGEWADALIVKTAWDYKLIPVHLLNPRVDKKVCACH